MTALNCTSLSLTAPKGKSPCSTTVSKFQQAHKPIRFSLARESANGLLNFERTIIQCILPCGEKTSRWDLTTLSQAALGDLLLSKILLYPQKSFFKAVLFQYHTCKQNTTRILTLSLNTWAKCNFKHSLFTYLQLLLTGRHNYEVKYGIPSPDRLRWRWVFLGCTVIWKQKCINLAYAGKYNIKKCFIARSATLT